MKHKQFMHLHNIDFVWREALICFYHQQPVYFVDF